MAGDRDVSKLTWRAEPGQTHVVAVGISRYDIGPHFNLPLAAGHAVDFAKWALQCGVPAGNIHVFLSHEAYAGYKADLKTHRIDCRAAKAGELNQFLYRELRGISGDLLYLFWSGHGSISENKDRILFYEDLKIGSPQHLDLSHLLLSLRSQPQGIFKLQQAYIDACANRFEELNFEASPGIYRPGLGELLRDVRQLFFLAADSGQEALSGRFSEAVLKELALSFGAEGIWPPDPDEVRKSVQPQFEGTFQRPVQISWRTKSGDEGDEHTSGDLPATDYINRAAYAAGYPVRFLRRLAAMLPAYLDKNSEGSRGVLAARLSEGRTSLAR
jgi:hypothetical protein